MTLTTVQKSMDGSFINLSFSMADLNFDLSDTEATHHKFNDCEGRKRLHQANCSCMLLILLKADYYRLS